MTRLDHCSISKATDILIFYQAPLPEVRRFRVMFAVNLFGMVLIRFVLSSEIICFACSLAFRNDRRCTN